tara:strand:- start:184 stop:360 length:177 start_codon:yes stop_codon:yes gene_type:complete
MYVKACSECEKYVTGNPVYHTPNFEHVFCDAYCSNAWYSKTFEKVDAKTDQTENNNGS